MTEQEKENRIHSLALSFLGRQQIVPNLYADQIIRGYKEGYHQAEKDLEVKEVDTIEREVKEDAGGYPYIDATELYDYENDKPLAKAGDRVKVVFIKDK